MIEIIDKSKCSGCHACYNVCLKKCISMEADKEGFWYPKVNSAECVKCGLCQNVCPILHKHKLNNQPIAFAAYNKNEKVRMDSSSGGIFTLIAAEIINSGGVVFGAAFDENFDVKHCYADTVEGIEKFRGSKYVQSEIGDCFNQAKAFLEQGRKVLFTGTPCQIGGLTAFLHKEYDNLICQDIICHGVPSPKVWRKYISYQEHRADSKARRIAFRSKHEGWKRYSVSLLFDNDTGYRKNLNEDLFMRGFLANLYLRPSCYGCSFKTLNRESDITLADFWGVQTIMPEMDDDKGTSLIIVNSDKGKNLFNIIQPDIIFKEVNINEAVKYNKSAYQSVSPNDKRDLYFKELENKPFDNLIQKYCHISTLVKLKHIIKKCYGLLNYKGKGI